MTTATALRMLDLQRFEQAPLQHQPFDYVLVDDVLQASGKDALGSDFPKIDRRGSFPLSTLQYGPAFADLIEELCGQDFAHAVGGKFGLDLSQYRTRVAVRGQCSATADGAIYTDSRDKILTVLLYLNPQWVATGGRLRLLRSKDWEDYAVEVPPTMGRLLVFKRSECSWHGHKPFEGKRLSLQINWVQSDHSMRKERFRHKVRSFLKKICGKSTYEG